MNQLVISFAQGSGGHWLLHFIDCLINNIEFVEQRKNWHPQYNDNGQLALNHSLQNPDIVLSSKYPYNLWCNYFIKTIKHEHGGLKPVILPNGQQVRLLKSPYDKEERNSIVESDFNWLFYQVRFIIDFNKTYKVNLYYEDLITNPDKFYNQVIAILQQKQINFVDNKPLFYHARNSFLKSIDNIRNKVPNPAHWHYQFWEMAYIDSYLNDGPSLGWYRELGTDSLNEFVLQYRNQVLTETGKLFNVI